MGVPLARQGVRANGPFVQSAQFGAVTRVARMQRTGRPRDPHIDGAVLDATLTMLSETGYRRLSVEKVARRAGTTKPAIYRRVLADCTADDLRATFMTTLFDPPRTAVAAVLDRALARGDLRADLDRDLTVDLLASLVHYRALYGHAATDAETVEHIVATLLNGIAADVTATEHHHELV